MSHAVLLLVTFPCYSADVVAELARKHAVLLGVDPSQELVRGGLDSGVWEAVEFLVDTWRRPSNVKGHNGGVFSWGTQGNYTDGKAFVTALKPFFHAYRVDAH